MAWSQMLMVWNTSDSNLLRSITMRSNQNPNKTYQTQVAHQHYHCHNSNTYTQQKKRKKEGIKNQQLSDRAAFWFCLFNSLRTGGTIEFLLLRQLTWKESHGEIEISCFFLVCFPHLCSVLTLHCLLFASGDVWLRHFVELAKGEQPGNTHTHS